MSNGFNLGKAAGAGMRAFTALDGFNALNDIVGAAQEYLNLHEVERTKRANIEAAGKAEVARIKAAEHVLRDYFERVFAERKSNFDALFGNLDTAIANGDGQTVTAVLNSIVDIAKQSPIAELGDLSEVRALLRDPDTVWEI
ncbi:hypothetical protein [Mycolicibacterium fortuitum]|uniref:Uncharacterized protein n=2 Tax=Mycolicibacterium fortuitum TaxID=1766 RepID=A0AAE4VI83_MYCFO|nr:hypothetical protein [Mycolicibacterium fortuitum]MDV7194955.1 hypothetical protein [Mycolicibacterium fortuitum]MDV7208563.1 hypothetical protein [Mycolicibacterium fortuitum]MDV7230490.1 hypothetical protein [Mycolicibacterium fortuitum]MDV7262104.1 hypothetical protein [Mycolicibacterium fortuitum]MDV7287420.1 hypothetical protein [Mycolicibacterium fortuitum]